jgi:hypothetical protein
MKKSFIFVGAPGEKLHKDEIEHIAFDLDFSGGVAVEVTDPHIIAKLEGNSHFEEVKPKAQASTGGDKPISQMNTAQLEAAAAKAGVTIEGANVAEKRADLKAKLEAKKDGENDS